MGDYVKNFEPLTEPSPEEQLKMRNGVLNDNDKNGDKNGDYLRSRSHNGLTTNYSQATLSDTPTDGVWDNGYHAKPLVSDMKISHAMVVACSALYCVKLTAIGLAFPLAYLIMFNTAEGFGAAIYRGYPIYLYSVGIAFQVMYLTNHCCNKKLHMKENVVDDLRSFGSKGYRLLTAMCGIVSAAWFIILFSWIMEVYSMKGNECTERNLEAASLALAFVYTALHIVVGFYNTKIFSMNNSFIILLGMMHMIGTNLSTWGWTAAHFTILTILRLDPNVSARLDCEMGSTLGPFVLESHSYFGIIVSIYFLVSSALMFAAFAHHYEEGTFRFPSTLEEKFKKLLNNNSSLKVSIPGFVAGGIILSLSIIFVVFHYVLIIQWEWLPDAQMAMEIVAIVLKVISFSACVTLLLIQNKSLDADMSRRILFESIIMVVSLFMLYIYDVCYAISYLRQVKDDMSLNYLAGASYIVEIIETTIQTTFLLSAMKYTVKLIPSKYYALDKSCVIYLMIHNVIIATFSMMRQYDVVYGDLYSTLFGTWFWSVFKFYLNGFVVLFRLYSTVFFGSLWLRCLRNE